MIKKLIKLAIIRNDDDTLCPFGLPISQACQSAGDSVDNMQVIDEDDDNADKLIELNLTIWAENPEPKRCKYAAHIFKRKPHAVDCNYGDTAAGLSQKGVFVGSPYYTQVFEGLGMAGLLTNPISTDPSGYTTRNLYYGIQGYAAKKQLRTLLRQALVETLYTYKK